MSEPKLIGGYRHYNCNGGWYPSVTTILGETNPAKQGYAYWRKKNPEASEAATTRGSILHKYCENRLKDGARDAIAIPDDVSPYVASISPFLGQISRVACLEQFVWHRAQRFAGTLDCCAVLDGKLTLFDWKTTKALPTTAKSLERHVADYRIQVAAYAAALRDTTGVIVQQGAVVVAHPAGEALVILITEERLQNLWRQFIGRRAQFDELLQARQAEQQEKESAIKSAFEW